MDLSLIYVFPPFIFTGEACYCKDYCNEQYIAESHLSGCILNFVNVVFFFNFNSTG